MNRISEFVRGGRSGANVRVDVWVLDLHDLVNLAILQVISISDLCPEGSSTWLEQHMHIYLLLASRAYREYFDEAPAMVVLTVVMSCSSS